MELLSTSLVDWSRAQFALTAMYHWLFVPLTLGLGIIQAIMETIYVKTGNEEWKKAAKFWICAKQSCGIVKRRIFIRTPYRLLQSRENIIMLVSVTIIVHTALLSKKLCCFHHDKVVFT